MRAEHLGERQRLLDQAETLLRFWCDEVGPAGWYRQDAALDRAMAERFEPLWWVAKARFLGGWLGAPPTALALLVLLDQVPRNIFRGTHAAFASDAAARRAASLALALGHDLRIPSPERQFFYLPLMHSESLPDQARSLRLILLRMEGETREANITHAIAHRDVIRRFGRFPSRNAALGRADTAAERAYRAVGGYMG